MRLLASVASGPRSPYPHEAITARLECVGQIGRRMTAVRTLSSGNDRANLRGVGRRDLEFEKIETREALDGRAAGDGVVTSTTAWVLSKMKAGIGLRRVSNRRSEG